MWRGNKKAGWREAVVRSHAPKLTQVVGGKKGDRGAGNEVGVAMWMEVRVLRTATRLGEDATKSCIVKLPCLFVVAKEVCERRLIREGEELCMRGGGGQPAV